MARHGAIDKTALAFTAEQNSLIEHVWDTIDAKARAMLADTESPRLCWEEANLYDTLLYNHLSPYGKGDDGRAENSHQETFNWGPTNRRTSTRSPLEATRPSSYIIPLLP